LLITLGGVYLLALIYLRVSTEDQAREGYSLEVQENSCRQRAAELGCSRVEIFTDSVTGEILNRPALMAVLDRIAGGGVEYFVCYDPDRLARTLVNQLVITEKIEKAGVKIDFVNFEWKNTPENRLFYQFRGSIAEYEKAKILMRTSEGKRKKAEKGLLTHNPGLYGYGFNKETDMLYVEAAAAEIVRMMYSWMVEDCSGRCAGPYEVARRLNDLKIPPPRGPKDKNKEAVWHRATVRRILANETYTGVLYLRVEDATGVRNNRHRPVEEKVSRKKRPREEWCVVRVPAIIDRQTWEEVQFRLRDARRLRPGKTRAKYLLSGMVRCGLCSHTMHGNRVKKKNQPGYYRYYVCTAKSPGITGVERCRSSNLPAGRLEKTVWDKVTGCLAGLQLPDREPGNRVMVDNLKLLGKEMVILRQQLEETAVERARIIRGYQKGIIPEDEAGKILSEVEERRKRLEKRRAELKAGWHRQGLPGKEQAALKKAANEFAARLSELTFEEKQYVLRLLVDKIIIKGRNLIIRVRIPVLPGGNDPEKGVENLGCRNRTLWGGTV